MTSTTSAVSPPRGLADLIFDGPELDKNSIAITDLATSLVAIQGIINKSYLFHAERLFSNSKLNNVERRKISLQIQTQRQGSDIYQLIPVCGQIAVGIVGAYLYDGLKALSAYTKKTVFSHETPTNQALVVSLHSEIAALTQRINNASGISQIDLILAEQHSGEGNITLNIDNSTKKYVRECTNQKLYGEITVIRGHATKFDIQNCTIDIQEESGRHKKVYLSIRLFEEVRYRSRADALLEITGRPIYRFGNSTREEFEAEKLFKIKS
jgi:hypothetical protein